MLKLTDEQKKACYASGYFRRYTFEFDGFTLDAEFIHTESVTIKGSICEETELKLGGCIASSCEFEVSETVTDNINLSGLRFRAYLHLYRENTEISTEDIDNPDEAIGEEIGVIPMGVYRVQSVEMIDDADYKKVIAYDDLYDWGVDVSDWYNTVFPDATTKVYIHDLRISLLEHLIEIGVATRETLIHTAYANYENDYVYITKGIEPNGNVSAVDILRFICELNCGFGVIRRDGTFDIITLSSGSGVYPEEDLFPEDSKSASANLYPEDNFLYLGGGDSEDEDVPDFITTHYEEFNVQKITCVSIKTESSEETVAVNYPDNAGDNPYLTTNALVAHSDSDTLKEIAKGIYEVISNVSYRPNTTTLQGIPWYEPGDYYNVTKKIPFESFVLSRTLTGIQGLRDEFVAQGTETRENTTTANEESYAELSKYLKITKLNDLFAVELGDLAESTTARFEMTAAEINMEVAKNSDVWDESNVVVSTRVTGVKYNADMQKYYVEIPISDVPSSFNDGVVLDTKTGMTYVIDSVASSTVNPDVAVLYMYQVADGQLHKITEELNSRITTTTEAIEAEVSRAETAENGMRTDYSSQIQLTATQIESSVSKNSDTWSTPVTISARGYGVINRSGTILANIASEETVSGYYLDEQTGRFFRILQCADADIDGMKQLTLSYAGQGTRTTENLSSRITQTESEINLRVEKGNVISSINQTAEAITIDASKVNLNGYVTLSGLSGDGTTNINGANIKTGTIDASRVNVTNLNASNIKTGTIDADRINLNTIASKTASPITFPSSGGIDIGTGENAHTVLRQDTISTHLVKGIKVSGAAQQLILAASSEYASGNMDPNIVLSKTDMTLRTGASHTIYFTGNTLHLDTADVYSSGINKETQSAAANVFIGGDSGHIVKTTNSSRRYKHDITTDIKESLNPHKLLSLPISQYKFNTDYLSNSLDRRYNIDVIGFIAEDVAEHYPMACEFNDYGMVENWNERYIIPPMLSLIQEMYQKINVLESKVKELGGNLS